MFIYSLSHSLQATLNKRLCTLKQIIEEKLLGSTRSFAWFLVENNPYFSDIWT